MNQDIIVVSTKSGESKTQHVSRIIKENFSGRIFRAVNVKKDGSLREYRALTGVSKHVKGGWGNTTSHVPNLITIYDMGLASSLGQEGIVKEGAPYRSFNMETAIMLEFVKGETKTTYLFVDKATEEAIADGKVKNFLKSSATIIDTTTSVLLGALK